MDDNADTEQTDTPQDSPETVQLAKEMGWKNPDEWKGDPPKSGFVSASEYVRRSEKVLPLVNARARKAEGEVSALRAELETTRQDHRKTIDRIERMSTLALSQQREQLEHRYAARKEAAVEVGDKDAYKQAVKDEKEAVAALDERMKEPEPEKKNEGSKLPKAVEDIIEGWRSENPWYVDEPGDEMTAYANARHVRLQKEKKGLSLKENLEQVTKDVRKRFPEHFDDAGDEGDDEPRRRGSPVESGSRMNGGGQGSGFSRLPADAKKQADRFIKEDGLFLEKGETLEKNLAQARERYAKQYFGDEA